MLGQNTVHKVGVHECLRTYSDACWDGESSEEWSPHPGCPFMDYRACRGLGIRD